VANVSNLLWLPGAAAFRTFPRFRGRQLSCAHGLVEMLTATRIGVVGLERKLIGGYLMHPCQPTVRKMPRYKRAFARSVEQRQIQIVGDIRSLVQLAVSELHSQRCAFVADTRDIRGLNCDHQHYAAPILSSRLLSSISRSIAFLVAATAGPAGVAIGTGSGAGGSIVRWAS